MYRRQVLNSITPRPSAGIRPDLDASVIARLIGGYAARRGRRSPSLWSGGINGTHGGTLSPADGAAGWVKSGESGAKNVDGGGVILEDKTRNK